MNNIERWDQHFLRLALEAARMSKDPSAKVGAVLVKDRREISTGYNGFAPGVVDSEERLNNRPVKLDLTIHAEKNAILNAARIGAKTKGCTAYLTHHPCIHCFVECISAGIVEFVYISNPQFEERWKSPLVAIVAAEAGISIRSYDKEFTTKEIT